MSDSKQRIRVKVDFVVAVSGSALGITRINDFIAGGLREVLAEEDFPLDIEPGAKMAFDNLSLRPARRSKRPR